jgi:hypothetical protein
MQRCAARPNHEASIGRGGSIATSRGNTEMLLTKHEGVAFENETVYISGQAFLRCSFVGCTLVLRETVYHMDGCSFDRCNWHVDTLLLWGSAQGVAALRDLVGLIEQGLQQVQAAEAQGGNAPAGAQPGPSA